MVVDGFKMNRCFLTASITWHVRDSVPWKFEWSSCTTTQMSYQHVDIYVLQLKTMHCTSLQYCNAVVGAETEIQALQFTTTQMQWSSWISRLLAILITRYSPSKRTTTFVSYCVLKPTFTHISACKCPILMGFSANCSSCDVV